MNLRFFLTFPSNDLFYGMVDQNYRSHPVILMPPSAIFYNDSLQPLAKNGVISWTKLRSRDMPLKFVGDPSLEDTDDEVRSKIKFPSLPFVLTILSAFHGSTLDKSTLSSRW